MAGNLHRKGSDASHPDAAAVAAGVATVGRIMRVVVEGPLGRSLKAGAGAAGGPGAVAGGVHQSVVGVCGGPASSPSSLLPLVLCCVPGTALVRMLLLSCCC